MARDLSQLPSDLEAYFTPKIKDIKKKMARAAATDLYSAYDIVMDDFYSRPEGIYIRTGRLRETAERNESVNNAGIKITGDDSRIYKIYGPNSSTYPGRKITINNVLTLMWDQGIRGLPKVSYVSDEENKHYEEYRGSGLQFGTKTYSGTPDAMLTQYVEDLASGENEGERLKQVGETILQDAIDHFFK